MYEPLEYIGRWWLPDDPENQIAGSLKFSPETGVVLQLIGTFFGEGPNVTDPDIPLILGLTTSGRLLTLHKNIVTNESFSFPGITNLRIHSHFLFDGHHFQQQNELKFISLSAMYDHLDAWAQIDAFKILYLERTGVDVSYRFPAPVEAVISDDLTISLEASATFPSLSLVQTEATVRQSMWMKATSSEARDFQDLLTLMGHLRNLMSLAALAPVRTLKLRGRVATSSPARRGPEVTVLYQPIEGSREPKKLLPPDLLFGLPEVWGRLDTVLGNWLSKVSILEPVFNLYFASLTSNFMFLDERFMNLIRATESFHRRLFGNQGVDMPSHRAKMKTIIDAIPGEYREWLKEKMSHSHELSLASRIDQLIEMHRETITIFISDKTTFIRSVVDNRNYRTHYDKSLERRVVSGRKLLTIVKQLQLLIAVLMLSELGFNEHEIRAIVSRNLRLTREIDFLVDREGADELDRG